MQPQEYGSSFDNLFAPAAAELRYGVPHAQGTFPKQAPRLATVGQPAPYLTVQCGKFTAPVQREARGQREGRQQQNHQASLQQDMGGWNQQGGHHSYEITRSAKVRLCLHQNG